MTESRWKSIGPAAEIREGEMRICPVGDDKVLVTRRRGVICACGAQCPHAGGPLGDGFLKDGVVVCPWHNARFNVEDGKVTSAPALDDLPTYVVKEEEGIAYLGARRDPAIVMPRGADDRCFAIVGGGAAGNAAAEALRRRGFAGRIVLITAESELPYDRTMLSKSFLSGKSGPGELPLRSEAFYRDLQVELLKNRTVTSFDPASLTILCNAGGPLKADGILFATGSRAIQPPIAGIELRNCFPLRSVGDATALLDAVERASGAERRIVVIGAGFIGTEAAASLTQQGHHVHLVAPDAVPMGRIFGARIGRWLQRLHEENGVHLHLETEVRRVVGDDAVRAVELSDGTTIETSVVLYATGVEPCTDFVTGVDKDSAGGILVDPTLATSVQGAYAAGDIASVPYLGGARGRIEHWTEAERQGAHAAGSMLGERVPYTEIPFFWTRQYTSTIKFIGLPVTPLAIEYRGDVEDGDFVAGYYADNGELTAGASVGRNEELLVVERMLREGALAMPRREFGSSSLWEKDR